MPCHIRTNYHRAGATVFMFCGVLVNYLTANCSSLVSIYPVPKRVPQSVVSQSAIASSESFL